MTCGSCQAAADLKTKAAMCHTCRGRPRCHVYHVATVKIGNFSPVGECPRGRWPTEGGKVRWLRMDWWGVPYPLRLRIGLSRAWEAFRQATARDYLAGCGCHVFLKSIWLKRPWKRYNVAEATSQEPAHGSVPTRA